MIDIEELDKTFRSCLYTTDEVKKTPKGQVPPGAVIVEGIMGTFGFEPVRLEAARAQVKGWLAQLPDEFLETPHGGTSFLQGCMTRDGLHWGEHRNMEQLFCLGMGLGLVTRPFPREIWSALYGGMPYYAVKNEVRS